MDPLFRTEFALAEDWDLWLRLSARYDFILSPQVLVRYTIVQGSISRKYTPEYFRTICLAIYSSWLQDPQLKNIIERHWNSLLANLHFQVASRYYEANQIWLARKEILACAVRCPLCIKWQKALGMLLLPPPVWRAIRRSRTAAYERNRPEHFKE